MEVLNFQCLTWDGYDHPDKKDYYVYSFGRTEEGKSVAVKFPFRPFFYVGMVKNDPDTTHKSILRRVCGTAFGVASTKRGECYKHGKSYCSCPSEEVSKEWNDYQVWGIHKFSKHSAVNLWGFNEGNQIPLLKVECNSKRQFYYCIKKIKEYDGVFQLFETNIDPILRVLHLTNCSSTGWIEVPLTEGGTIRETTCDHEVELSGWRQLSPLKRQDIAPFRVGSFDIECFSESGAFPQSTKKEDLVFQIALSRQDYGREGEMVQGLSLDPCLDKDTKTFKTEKELLMGFRDLVIEWDLDIITGWNVFGFDFEYIMNRYKDDKAFMDRFGHFGRFLDDRGKSKLTEKVLSSSAMGDNKMNILPMSGRFVFDMMQHVKREMNMDSYSLNNVSKTLLGDKKIDMPPSEIFDRWRRQDAEEIGEVSKYCIKDTLLPLSIMDKLKTVPNLIEMAKATWVPLVYLTERGQQIKVFSLMVKTATENGYCIPARNSGEVSEDEYQGATVLEPIKGAYYDPIVALDFASLYPSIMRAHNLCYSTYVFDTSTVNKELYEYEEFEIQGKMHYFVSKRKGNEEKVFALLPKILADLKEFRGKAKRDMAMARGTPLEEIFNGKQLAYKVVMNSVYGFTGVSRGMLGLKPIASAVTCRGRQMIDETKAIVEKNFDQSTVVYGDTDSVMVKFNLPSHLTADEKIAESWKLGEKAAEMCKFPYPNELELEKVYCPYILYSKKRYAAKMWVQNKKGDMEMEKIDIKGLQVVRRDQTPFARRVGKKVLDILLDSNDSKPALDYAMDMGKLLLSGGVTNEDLLETRSLKDDGFRTALGTDPSVYEEFNLGKPESKKIAIYAKRNLPHVWVRDKMWDRRPGSEPRQGERVSFLVTDTGNPKHKLFEKADDPVFVEENGIQLDYIHYFNKLKKPINDLIAPVVGEGADPLEALIPKITSLEQCTTKEHIDKFSVKDIKEWCSARISLPKGISKWKKPDWVHQACVIKKINQRTPLEIAFSFSNF